jgi:hypothetical protein
MRGAADVVGEIHAVLLAALLLAVARAALAGARNGAEGGRRRALRALAGLAAGVACAAWLSRLAAHPGCPRGEPLLQWLVPSAALAAAVALVGPLGARLRLAGLSLALGYFGTTSYLEAVHHEAWTGARGPVLAAPDLLEFAAESLARAGAEDRTEYPAGFVSGSPAFAAHAGALALVPLASVRIEGDARWHTPLTRLYRQRHTAVGVWFPGGTLAAGAARLSLRELPPERAAEAYLRHAHRAAEWAAPER